METQDFDEIELVTDGDGIALIGPPSAVDLFLSTHMLESHDLDLPRLGSAFGGGAATLKAGSELAANSGRWMKLTEESWAAAQHLPKVARGRDTVQATLRAPNGQFAKNLQFLKTPGSILTNPAILAGAAGIMAQLAMQQTMDEITDYLASIDEKVDDVLRAQKDAVFADMIGVDLVLEEAMTIRKEVGRVSEITWSKVQGTSMTIARTQAYALQQLDALAEKLESKSVSDLADASKKAEQQAQDWLAVLAHCFYLQEASGVIEIDRVLDTSPEELDRHRAALVATRAKRLDMISRATGELMTRLASAVAVANSKVLLSPMQAPAVVKHSTGVATAVIEFDSRLGVGREHQSLEARRWARAAIETRDDVIRTGAEGVDAAVRFGTETLGRTKGAADKIANRLTDRVRRLRGDMTAEE